MTHISLTDFRWDSSCEEQTKNSSYYNQAWLDLITKLYGYSLSLLTTTNAAGQVTGILPLCFMESSLIGRRLVSLPSSDLCPLVAVDEANALVDQAIEIARQKRVRYLELRTGINEALAHHPELCEGNLYVRWLLPLNPDPDAIWSGLRKPVQHQIKKSRKLGVQDRIAQRREDMAHYYQLHLQTRSKKQGMPTQPQRSFFGLWDASATNGAMQLLLAELEISPTDDMLETTPALSDRAIGRLPLQALRLVAGYE